MFSSPIRPLLAWMALATKLQQCRCIQALAADLWHGLPKANSMLRPGQRNASRCLDWRLSDNRVKRLRSVVHYSHRSITDCRVMTRYATQHQVPRGSPAGVLRMS